MTRLPHPQSPLTHHPRRDIHGYQEALNAWHLGNQSWYIQKVLYEREDIGAVEEREVSDCTVLVLVGLYCFTCLGLGDGEVRWLWKVALLLVKKVCVDLVIPFWTNDNQLIHCWSEQWKPFDYYSAIVSHCWEILLSFYALPYLFFSVMIPPYCFIPDMLTPHTLRWSSVLLTTRH